MNGTELRQARTDLGWSRLQLAERSGLTAYQISVIETGRREPKPAETEALRLVLLQQVDALVTTGETPIFVVATDVEPSGEPDRVRLTEWNGLRRGDYVRVRDLRGRFRFLYHHQDAWGEYVELYGPEARPKERSITVDRVILPKR